MKVDTSKNESAASPTRMGLLLMVALGSCAALFPVMVPVSVLHALLGIEPKFIVPVRTLLVAALLYALLRRQGFELSDVGLRLEWRWATWIWVLMAVAAIILTGQFLQPWLASFLPSPRLAASLTPDGSIPDYLYWVIAVGWVGAAIGEEFIFRGFLLKVVERLLHRHIAGTLIAVMFQALLFGVAHYYQGAAGVITTTLAGLIMAGLFLITSRNLLACVAAHGVVNTFGLTMVFLARN